MQSEAVVLIFLFGSATAVISWSLLLRYRRRELQHKERLLALEKGAPPPALTDVESRAPWTPRLYLLRGLIWLFTGIGLTVFLVGVAITTNRPRSAAERIREAQVLKNFQGATEEQVRQVQDDMTAREGLPIGFALVGLIPIGVGLAYLIFYSREGKNLAALVQRDE
jgi:hypothetical protein